MLAKATIPTHDTITLICEVLGVPEMLIEGAATGVTLVEKGMTLRTSRA
jgi:hypothetical protein